MNMASVLKKSVGIGTKILRTPAAPAQSVSKCHWNYNYSNCVQGQSLIRRTFASKHEPDYLDITERQIPTYDLLNFQIRGYDFPVLEDYGKFIHNTAERIGIDVEDSWAAPCKKLKVSRLVPESVIVESEYQLNIYERNVQISEVSTTMLPLFINMVEAALPSGVTLCVQPHLPEHTEVRYVPDLELKELREKLDTMTTKKDEPRRK